MNPTTGNVCVGGQVVRVDDTTEFGEDNPLRLGSVTVGERVRVSGVPDDKGGLRASRIDDSPGTSEDLEVKGFVSGLAGTSFTLKLSPDAADGYSVTLARGASLPAGVAERVVRRGAVRRPGHGERDRRRVRLARGPVRRPPHRGRGGGHRLLR